MSADSSNCFWEIHQEILKNYEVNKPLRLKAESDIVLICEHNFWGNVHLALHSETLCQRGPLKRVWKYFYF
jgi:hypothetical protein